MMLAYKENVIGRPDSWIEMSSCYMPK